METSFMNTVNKDFEADMPSIGMRLCATGFTGSCRFVSVAIGTGVVNSGEYSLLVSPAEARGIAEAFTLAADYAEPADAFAECAPVPVPTMEF